MTRRSPRHSRPEARLSRFLDEWLDKQARPRGLVVSGEAAFRVLRDPDTLVGIDVAYLSAELAAATTGDAAYFDGAPILAVEILSPSDTQRRIHQKIHAYRQAEVQLIWIVDPFLQTVMVLRLGQQPILFNRDQELTAEPELPGFRVPVARLFED